MGRLRSERLAVAQTVRTITHGGEMSRFAVIGGESGMDGLIRNETIYQQITFEALSNVPSDDRLSHAITICTKAKVRYPKRKGEFIIGCYNKLHEN